MCDPDVLWLRDFQHSLEIIAYYALQNVTIPTWSQCLREDGKEFLKRNYTSRFLQVLECEKGRSIILTLRLGLGLVDDGPAIDYLGGTLLAFQPRPVTLAPLPSYHTSGAKFKSSKESRKYMK